MEQKIRDSYGYLFEEDLIQEITKKGVLKEVKEGDLLIDIEDTITNIPLMLSGAIKISRIDEEGDELLLYFIEKGDVCAMTLTCCIGQSKSEIRAIAESDTEVLMVPVENMDLWLQKYSSWRSFVFESYNTRFSEMLQSIDSLAFMNMHERLIKYLREKVIVGKDMMVNTTHQKVASDLHTSRVVISRILKSLERENKIVIHRNNIQVLEF
ncbi:MAG: Crp/Fnr family transcriptional regulator [Flavobacteriales bacterium]|jgi:CRP/FNR family transcriptional regulator, anaerobic regulatory protein